MMQEPPRCAEIPLPSCEFARSPSSLGSPLAFLTDPSANGDFILLAKHPPSCFAIFAIRVLGRIMLALRVRRQGLPYPTRMVTASVSSSAHIMSAIQLTSRMRGARLHNSSCWGMIPVCCHDMAIAVRTPPNWRAFSR